MPRNESLDYLLGLCRNGSRSLDDLRPILSFLYKVHKILFKEQLVEYRSAAENFIYQYQSGYTVKHNSETVLLHIRMSFQQRQVAIKLFESI